MCACALGGVEFGPNELTGQGECIPCDNEARVLLQYNFTFLSACVRSLFKCILYCYYCEATTISILIVCHFSFGTALATVSSVLNESE